MFGIALELQLFGMLGAGRLAADLGLVIDADRVGGVEVHDAAILDQHRRHAVERRGHEIAIVEADIERPGRDRAVPVDLAVAEAQMPFAADSSEARRVGEEWGSTCRYPWSPDH